MGDLPLRTPTDRCLGGPLPRQQANQTHPHPLAINLCSSSDVLIGKHRVLIRLSPGYALLRGRLDTRYSPVRRSPSTIASNRHAAPRLACVKPVASVHPEPGSNSTLYNFYASQKNYTAFVVARKRKQALFSLAPRNLVKSLCIVYSVSERLSGSFFIRLLARPYQEIETVCFLPKYTYNIYSLLVLLLSLSM